MIEFILTVTKLMAFLLMWVVVGGWMVYKWVRTAERQNGGFDKTEHIQMFLLVCFWIMLGVEVFVRIDYFNFNKWLLVLGSLIASQIPGAIEAIKGFNIKKE